MVLKITQVAPADIVITQPMIILLIVLRTPPIVTKTQLILVSVRPQATVVVGQEVIIPIPVARLVLV